MQGDAASYNTIWSAVAPPRRQLGTLIGCISVCDRRGGIRDGACSRCHVGHTNILRLSAVCIVACGTGSVLWLIARFQDNVTDVRASRACTWNSQMLCMLLRRCSQHGRYISSWHC
ncbi:hypothetical protein BC629DRAFT_1728705 [Irpex lacteus]|nr:hypothetical protein BC629DRAFT_1728705 [Irpex lacteus]